MATPLLEVRNLRVGFQTDNGLLTAVDDVDFTLETGQTLGVVGESGCGKSVTAMSLMRLLPQPSGRILGGEVLLEGRDLTKLPIEDMRKIRGNDIAMIFQEPMTALNPVQRVGKQIIEAIQLHEPMSPDKALKRAVELMEWVGIPAPDQRVNEYPHQLSGGMRQRVMIAMALSCHPKVLIADEPTTALDVTVQAQILDLLKRLQRETGMAVILITHDLGVIAEVCDDVAVMYAGRIVERGPVHEIFAKPLHPYTQGLIHCLPKLDHPPKTDLPVIPGMVPSLRDMPAGCRFASRCPNQHSADVLTQRQPWKECGSGHGVEACVCFADTLAKPADTNTLHKTTSAADETDLQRLAQDSLQAAHAFLRASPVPDGPPQGSEARRAERERQLRILAEYARGKGCLITTAKLEALGTPQDTGSEHTVYYHEPSWRAWKVTLPGRCGNTFPEGRFDAALPSEYLERWQKYNEVLGDHVRFEGVIETADGISVIISQRWIAGERPEREAIQRHMEALGFMRTAGPHDFYRAEDNLAVLDCHEDNFVLTEPDIVVPIDVHVMSATAGLKRALMI
ncbi:MAG: oligopeptide/dipeptide ABC transporter ATP-binding protein [Prosthecobacter sp.]|uniref:oligopeptide/dipeptide ABC transporter ATP-binding protein n=1 Tax=Prosthecobacter sp. TaxID=1965333 RepID=UPI003901E6BE